MRFLIKGSSIPGMVVSDTHISFHVFSKSLTVRIFLVENSVAIMIMRLLITNITTYFSTITFSINSKSPLHPTFISVSYYSEGIHIRDEIAKSVICK